MPFNTSTKKIGLFIGRFQPFHKGHLDALEQIRKKVDIVKILIGSSNKKRTFDNPLSYTERKEYMKSVLPFTNYKIYPCPDVDNDDQWIKNILQKVGRFDTAYVTKNSHVERIFKKYNIPFQKTKWNLSVSATDIRKKIRANDKTYQKLLVRAPFPKVLYNIIAST